MTQVQHNMNAINAYNRLNANVAGLKKASEKLASGYRINRAGDDAAGLAISEKMRSQIKGLNQAVRNSQDGINMIQTFEGAAQETHSILQRMKELATESANGTYDNPTDRAAIQLEFDHLNDELNQIADTDFNGTIVLNGGEMADGLKVSNLENGLGDFDYANKADQTAAAAKAILDKLANGELDSVYSKDKLAELQALADQKKAVEASSPKDIVKDTTVWGTVDEHGYQADQAKQLWDDLGLDAAKDSYVDITFEATVADDGTISYKAINGATNSGATVDVTSVTANAINGAADTTGKGGFTVDAGGTATTNAIFDATGVKTGDVVTLRFTGPGAAPKAPTNIGFADDSLEFTGGVDTDETKYAITMGTDLKDADMTDEIKEVLDTLNGSEWELTVANGTKAPTANTGVKIGGTAVTGGGIVATAGGNKYIIETANDKIKVSTVDAAGTAADKELFTIDLTGAADSTAAGSVKFTLNLDAYSFSPASAVDASAQQTPASVIDTTETDAKLADINSKVLKAVGVSIADAFDNSTARMSYAENITLQTGARTKDAVNFNFNYNADGTADMGTLKANLNLSARADGLNTANLSLADQDSANHAIDQIDKAINKTSMVRASFGAIQNRLEHKITNLTTTSENLTEAESSIRDTDMASEMMNYTKFNILQQAAQSMLAQANQQPQSILQLLG